MVVEWVMIELVDKVVFVASVVVVVVPVTEFKKI